jgi:hypothetical protein
MKKKETFVAATEEGIMVAVKAVLTEEQLAKVELNKERVDNMLKEANAMTIGITDPKFNFGIGTISSGQTSSKAIAKEEERMDALLDEFKDLLSRFPKPMIDDDPEKEPEKHETDQDAVKDPTEDDATKEAFINEFEEKVKTTFPGAKYALFIDKDLEDGYSGGLAVSTIHPIELLCLIHEGLRK